MTPKQALKIAMDDIQYRMQQFAPEANLAQWTANPPPGMRSIQEKYKLRAQALQVLEGMLSQKELL